MPTPYTGQRFVFTNPDGSQVHVRGFGNQFAAVFETDDGFTVVKDPASGFFHYAQRSPDGTTLVPTGPRVGEIAPGALTLSTHLRPAASATRARARAAREAAPVPRWAQRRAARKPRSPAPPTGAGPDSPDGDDAARSSPSPGVLGSYVGLCLLIDFPDVPGTLTRRQVTNFANKAGYRRFGNNGSVRDYFLAVSDGRLDYSNLVTAYCTAKHPRSYYTDPGVDFGRRARGLIKEGLAQSKARGLDFTPLTVDSAGFVRALNVFYAGELDNAWAEGLWPHSSALADPVTVAANRSFSDYQITNLGSELALRTFCHENGHMICDFPDLYDYGFESYGTGDYCLMSYGASDQNPAQVCAYLKHQAGWTSTLTTLRPGMTASATAGRNDFLRYARSATEYFLVENRAQTGRDEALPDSGLAIWHVDETATNNAEAMTADEHYECSLEQADGRFDLERQVNYGDAKDLFGAPDRRTFGASTRPDSRWWDGAQSGLDIVDIGAPGSTMTVTTAKAAKVDLGNLKFGVRNSADVVRLQIALNAHFAGLGLPTSGNYLQQTDAAVRRCQRRHGFGSDPKGKSFVGKSQAAHLGLRTSA
ncbi:MAG: M6 family metalloprotease domain-containing protein [Candidatus Nanopelagicales bacterium]